jgi:23S rRNA A1618 N6-methylase RlmF
VCIDSKKIARMLDWDEMHWSQKIARMLDWEEMDAELMHACGR